ncbi:MAG: flagellar biosynthesis protein FlgC [Fluviicoccus sp.]|uniref:flagellar basal body rod protein FlgC n=1 Tax=Fluviicoccus sp. TaxID=2003552 RepID=UPI0027221B87|nr:flagellar basal body rod C-terminal domain-containing protein [Fluviicoccus sp.]MDO8330484.1 flagellar biosynthesis protein FlgC [Fluviicoccus sp.]
MRLDNINEVVKAAMTYERQRVEAASFNLSMTNVAIAADALSPLRQAVLPSLFSSQLGILPTETRSVSAHREVHDPDHPMADARGMVHYPRVETATEMATLVSATRAYEADVRAYNSLRAMTLKAFEIGKQS